MIPPELLAALSQPPAGIRVVELEGKPGERKFRIEYPPGITLGAVNWGEYGIPKLHEEHPAKVRTRSGGAVRRLICCRVEVDPVAEGLVTLTAFYQYQAHDHKTGLPYTMNGE